MNELLFCSFTTSKKKVPHASIVVFLTLPNRLVNNKRGNSLPNIDLPVVAPNSSPNTTTYVTCTHQNVNSTVPQQMHTVPSSNKSSAVARQQVLNTLLEEGQKRPNVADDFSQPLRYTYVAAKPTMVTYCEEQPPQEPQFRMVYTGTSPLVCMCPITCSLCHASYLY